MQWSAGRKQPLLVLLPSLLLMAGILTPLFYLIVRTAGAGHVVWELLFRQRTLQILVRTIALVIGVTGLSLIVALPLAWLVTRTDLPLRRFWSVAAVLPLVMPSYVVGFVILAALGPRGMLQGVLERLFGVERLPEIYGYPGALLTIVIVSYPLMMLSIQASLRGLDPKLEEVSRSLGHTPWQTFFRVTLPMLRPGTTSGVLLVALYALKDFGAVSLLRYETFTWAIYLQYQTSIDRSAAAGLSLVLIALAFFILFVESITRGRAGYFQSGAGPVRPSTPVHLGKWKWPALLFCFLVLLFSLIAPMSVLAHWLSLGFSGGELFSRLWGPAINAIFVSGMAALTAVVFSLPLAYLTVRSHRKAASFMERIAYLGYALPGIVVALALVFFTARYLQPIYQTMGLLVFAYVLLFIPQSLGAVRSSLLQINPHFEEAARSLGKAPAGVMASITVPLARSGILAGGFLVFFTTMKELPATLILSPIGFKTLATSIWSATSEAFFSRAAPPALLLILASAIPLGFLTLRGKR